MSETLRPVNRSDEELAMRALIVPELRRRWPGGRVIHELPLRYSTVRIDLATVTPDHIVAVEIKSSRDVLDRLEHQVRAFLPISERVIVALAPTLNEKRPANERPRTYRRGGKSYNYTEHVPDLTEAQAILARIDSSFIETWSVDAETAQVNCDVLDQVYRGQDFPWLAEMLDMLHVAELRAIAQRHRIVSDKRSTHHYLKSQCAELMTGREIRRAVCAALRARDAFVEGTDAPIGEGPEALL